MTNNSVISLSESGRLTGASSVGKTTFQFDAAKLNTTFERIDNWVDHGDFETNEDLGLTDERYEDWVNYKKEKEKEGIDADFDYQEDVVDFYKDLENKNEFESDGGVELVKDKNGEIVSVVDRSQQGTNFAVHKFEEGARYESVNIDMDIDSMENTNNESAYADRVFDTLKKVREEASMTDPAQSFKFTVDSARDHYDDMKFSGQESLNKTFGAITRNLGEDFAGVITYAKKNEYQAPINRDGSYNSYGKLDCVGLMATSIYILDMSKDQNGKAQNANDTGHGWSHDQQMQNAGLRINTKKETVINAGSFEIGAETTEKINNLLDSLGFDKVGSERTIFDESSAYRNGVTQMLYNNSLFDRIDASSAIDDYTGLMGITEKTDKANGESRSYFDHVYVQTDMSKYGSTVESCGGSGITDRKANAYINRTKYYLQLKLIEDRLIK